MLNSDKYEILTTVGMVIGVVAISVMLALVLASCAMLEVNMVQRATLSDGDGTTSTQHDNTIKDEEDSMKFVVPIK